MANDREKVGLGSIPNIYIKDMHLTSRLLSDEDSANLEYVFTVDVVLKVYDIRRVHKLFPLVATSYWYYNKFAKKMNSMCHLFVTKPDSPTIRKYTDGVSLFTEHYTPTTDDIYYHEAVKLQPTSYALMPQDDLGGLKYVEMEVQFQTDPVTLPEGTNGYDIYLLARNYVSSKTLEEKGAVLDSQTNHWMGPLVAEKLVSRGDRVQQAMAFYFDQSRTDIRMGPVNYDRRTDTYYSGAKRGGNSRMLVAETENIANAKLTVDNFNSPAAPSNKRFSKKKFLKAKRLKMIKKRRNKPDLENSEIISDLYWNINDKNELEGFFNLNKSALLLSEDEIARKLMNNNPTLFDRNNNTTTLDLGEFLEIQQVGLLRRDITISDRPRYNSLGSLIGIAASADREENVICNSFQESGKVKKISRYRMNNGIERDIDETKIINDTDTASASLNDVLRSDIAAATLLCTLQQQPIYLNDMNDLCCFSIKDSSFSENSNKTVNYGIEIRFISKLHKYVKKHIRKLENMLFDLESYHLKSEIYYDFVKKEYKGSYFEEVHGQSDYGLTPKQYGYSIAPKGDNWKNSIWFSAGACYAEGSKLLSPDSVAKDLKEIYQKTNLIFGTPMKILDVIQKFKTLIQNVKNEYGLESDQDEEFFRVASTTDASSGQLKKESGRYNYKHFFVDSIRPVKPINLGIEFIGLKKKPTQISMISKADFRKRASQEKRKFFKGAINTSDSMITAIGKRQADSLTKFSDTEFSFFTPNRIKLGNKEKVLTDNTDDVLDNEFFSEYALIKNANTEVASMKGPSEMTIKRDIDVDPESNIDNLITSMGISISPPIAPLLSRKLEVQDDPMIDASDYLGDNAYFLNFPAKLEKIEKPDFSDDDKKSSHKFLIGMSTTVNARPVSKKLSLSEFNPTNPDSKIATLFTGKRRGDLKKLPLQLKSLILSNLNAPVRFPLTKGKFDPLKSIETKETIKQNFLNIKKLQYLSGYDIDEETQRPNLKRPLWVDMNKAAALSNVDLMCRLVTYENPNLGITNDENELPTLDGIFIMRA